MFLSFHILFNLVMAAVACAVLKGPEIESGVPDSDC